MSLTAFPQILVHCVGGINRSPLSVMYWVLTYHYNTALGQQGLEKKLWDHTIKKRGFGLHAGKQVCTPGHQGTPAHSHNS